MKCAKCKYSKEILNKVLEYDDFVCMKKVINRHPYTSKIQEFKRINILENKNGDCKYYKRKNIFSFIRKHLTRV